MQIKIYIYTVAPHLHAANLSFTQGLMTKSHALYAALCESHIALPFNL